MELVSRDETVEHGFVTRELRDRDWLFDKSQTLRFVSKPSLFIPGVFENLTCTVGKEVSRITHTNMMGGRWLIEDEHHDHFLNAVIQDLQYGYCLPPISEIHTSNFPMFFDVDLKAAIPTLSSLFVTKIVGCIQTAVSKFFPGGAKKETRENMLQIRALGTMPKDWFRVIVCTKFEKGEEKAKPLSMEFLEWELVDESHWGVPLESEALRERFEEMSSVLRQELKVCISILEEEVKRESMIEERSRIRDKIRCYQDKFESLSVVKFTPIHWRTWDTVNRLQIHSEHFVTTSHGDTFRPVRRHWKHGIHIHLPDVIIDVNKAGVIREAVICELSRERYFADELKTVPNWKDIVDEKVYNGSSRAGGLRMIGAPKTVRCRIKHASDDVCICNRHKGYIVDESIYWPTKMFLGTKASELFDVPLEVNLPSDLRTLLKITRVASKQNVPLTEGFDLETFQNVPRFEDGSGFKEGHRTKRKSREVEPTRDERALTRNKDLKIGPSKNFLDDGAVIKDERLLDILETQLYTHSKQYQFAKIRARYAGNKIFVTLSGEGSGFCLNLNGVHKSENVYMVVRMKSNRGDMESVMKCFCKCQILRRDNGGRNQYCSTFEDTKELARAGWARELFPQLDPFSDFSRKQAAQQSADLEKNRLDSIRNLIGQKTQDRSVS